MKKKDHNIEITNTTPVKKTATMIAICTMLSFLAAYLIADESGLPNPLEQSMLIYGVWVCAGIPIAGFAVIFFLLITPIRERKKELRK